MVLIDAKAMGFVTSCIYSASPALRRSLIHCGPTSSGVKGFDRDSIYLSVR
jgi:hypothetical protein